MCNNNLVRNIKVFTEGLEYIAFCGNHNNSVLIPQSPIIRTSLIRTDAEILGKFKYRALGSSNLRNTSKDVRNTRAQIFKAKNQVLSPFLIYTYLSLVFIYFQCLLWKCIFHLYIHKTKILVWYVCIKKRQNKKK